jgi:hypothetical protein
MRLPPSVTVTVSSFALTGLLACSSSNDTASTGSGGRDAGARDSGVSGAGGRSAAGGSGNGGRNAGGTAQAGADGSGGIVRTGGTSNAGTGGKRGDTLDSGDGQPDATSRMDATVPDDARASPDSGDTGAAPVRCDSSCPFGRCDGSACAVTKLVAAAGGVWDVAVVGSQIFWTEGFELSACTTPPCATAAVLASFGGDTYFGLVTAKSSGVDYLYVTNNTVARGLLRVGLSGTPNDSWGAAPNHAAAVATNGDIVVYGDEFGTYRVSVGTQGATRVMDAGPAFFASSTIQPGPPLHNVAVDGTLMFAASSTDVYKCPVAGNCVGAPVTAGAQPMAKVVALAVHGSTLYALGGTPFTVGGKEQIWSVSTSGGNVSNVASVSPLANGQGTPYGLLADDEHLYWGSLDGNLYTCDVAPTCVPTVLVRGARPMGMTQDQNAVYWGADSSGGAIYRVVKPH